MSNEGETNAAGAGPTASAAPIPPTFDAPDLPDWVLFHVPHDSTFIPPSERRGLLLGDAELKAELLRMTDHYTFDLFAQGISEDRVIYSPLSRLIVDVERFEEDALEIMASRGMGAIYERTSDGKQLRSHLLEGQRKELMNTWHFPHHHRLTERIERLLTVTGGPS